LGRSYCPYCAAERWSIIVALSKFGNFSGLTYMLSSAFDIDPSTLSGQNWTQIGIQLDSPSSTVAQRINGAADTLISAICKIDNGQPNSVCSQSYAQIAITQHPSPPSQTPLTGQFNPVQVSDRIEAPVLGKAG